MKAPPRNAFAPLRFTLFATSVICCSLSTEQGPAITVKLPGAPIFTPPMSITDGSGWNFLLAFLKGSAIRITRST